MLRWRFVRDMVHRLRPQGDNTRVRVSLARPPVTEEWVPIAVEGPAPLLEMYRDVLSTNGIPAMLRGEGAGRGGLGGASTLARLLVPAQCAQPARELLDLDSKDSDDKERGVVSERTQGGDER